mmetsp:Transcript_72972/g.204953  ORF Transcript_72972/g.204953 Transcript_72972/m.204953 type:complete len:258 (+) Transcript_72972:576-1349(+)
MLRVSPCQGPRVAVVLERHHQNVAGAHRGGAEDPAAELQRREARRDAGQRGADGQGDEVVQVRRDLEPGLHLHRLRLQPLPQLLPLRLCFRRVPQKGEEPARQQARLAQQRGGGRGPGRPRMMESLSLGDDGDGAVVGQALKKTPRVQQRQSAWQQVDQSIPHAPCARHNDGKGKDCDEDPRHDAVVRRAAGLGLFERLVHDLSEDLRLDVVSRTNGHKLLIRRRVGVPHRHGVEYRFELSCPSQRGPHGRKYRQKP